MSEVWWRWSKRWYSIVSRLVGHEGCSEYGHIVEGQLFTLDFLVLLVPFSGYKDHVTWTGLDACRANRLFSVLVGGHLARLNGVEPIAHFGDDGRGVFAARVVRSQDHQVCEVCGHLCHDGALGAVAVTTATHNT